MSTATLAKDTVYMLAARLVFVASAYFVHVQAGRSFGPRDYGAFGVIISLINLLELFLMRGFRDGVAKYVSELPERAAAVKRAGFRVQIIGSLALTAAYFAAAPAVAGILGDASLASPIRLSAVLVPFLSLYNFYSGYLGGKRAFGRRSVLLTVYALAKVAGVVAFIRLGWGVAGAIGGYIAAATAGMVLGALFSAERGRPEGSFPASRIVSFALPIIFYAGSTTLLMNLDLLLVKRLLPGGPAAGFYTAAGTLADIPQQVFVAFAITIFPAVSEAAGAGDTPRLRSYVTGSIRYLLIFMLPLAAFISAAARPVLRLVYSSAYDPAASALTILILGNMFLAVFYFLNAVISGTGRPRISMSLALVLIPLDVVLNIVLIRSWGIAGAALATTAACLVGVIGAGAYIRRRLGVLIKGRSFLRIAGSAAVLYVVPRFGVPPGFWLVPYGAVLFGAYFLILIMLKELDLNDIRRLLAVPVRRSGRGR
jgi:stage V sporulation protein B